MSRIDPYRPVDPLDLTLLVERMARNRSSRVLWYDQGRVAERSHPEVRDDVARTAEKLAGWGVGPGMRVGIRAPNSYAWIVHDLALIQLRAVSVAFTDDFADADAETLAERYSLSLLLDHREPGAEGRPAFVAPLEMGGHDGVRAVDRGAAEPDPEFHRPGLIFSSGSSGGVKGMVLDRRGIEATVTAFTEAVGPRPDDLLLLFLPISNFQQRQMYYSALWYGFDLVVTDASRLFRALKELRPTILIAPPIVYEAFETRLSNLPAWKRAAARVLGEAALRIPPAAGRRVARALFRDAHEALGGRMRFMVTGMAPIKRSTLRLFERMQIPLYETYGLIEAGSVALNLPGARKIGSVGRPLPGGRVELAEDGEIIVHKTHTIAQGYFACAEGEAERTFLGGGRVATGDVGRFDADGYLYVVGRKKEVIVTAGGEKVHPESVEAEIDACPDVARSVVFGGPGLPYLAAVVLPHQPGDPAARARIELFVRGLPRRAARVEKVVFTELAFTRENGLLRPNLKLDRRRIARHFQDELALRAEEAALV